MRERYIASWPKRVQSPSDEKRLNGSNTHKPAKLHISRGVGCRDFNSALITANSAALQMPLKIPMMALKKTAFRECCRKKAMIFIGIFYPYTWFWLLNS